MRQLIVCGLVACLLAAPAPPARSYTLQYTDQTAVVQVKWPTNVITIALSNSLNSPPANIEASPADVVAAARNALRAWSDVSNVQFNVVSSPEQDLDPTDGTSLITVSAINANQFSSTEQKGRTRRTTDQNGNILEGDVGVNPNVRFSTDGRAGTYDLESTLVHEIGHLLGLEHSGVVGATMQPRQAVNGPLGQAALVARTLAEDDRAGVRAVYGPRGGLGSVSGTVTNAASGGAVYGAHVWVEDVTTGKVMGGNVTLTSGLYRIDGLPPASYRLMAEPLNEPVNISEIDTQRGAYQAAGAAPPFLTREVGTLSVQADATSFVNFSVTGAPSILNPSVIGTNTQTSSVALPLVPGATKNVLVGGENVQAALGGVSVTSPYMTVSNVQDRGFSGATRIISFDVTVDVLAPPGEYSVRLQSAGEAAYLSGALVIDLPFGVTSGNLIDDPSFFVAQHYRDFFNREADTAGLNFWRNQITECGSNTACTEVRRNNVSAAFFLSREFQETGYLAYRAHGAAFGTTRVGNRVPLTYRDFLLDTQRLGRGVVIGQAGAEQRLEQNKQAYFNEFVQRADFLARYPAGMSAAQFVDALNANTGGVLTPAERDQVVAKLASGQASRAVVLRAIAEVEEFRRRELNRAFVLMQYFGYMRRNPSDPPEPTLSFAGYDFWLQKLNDHGGDYIAAEMIKAFITSTEYRRRFGVS